MSLLETLMRKERRIVISALAVAVVLSWAYVLIGAGMGMPAWKMTSVDLAIGRSGMDGVAGGAADPTARAPMGGVAMSHAMAAMATQTEWTFGYAVIVVVMWWVMMVAMMLPSAAPMILFFSAASRRQKEKGEPVLLPSGLFAGGYIVVWGFFSVVAAVLQWAFESGGILSPMMNAANLAFAGTLLVLAGLYQLTPVKTACLRHCRSPLQFLTGHWRAGRWGAFRMGVSHGAYCVGCCWGLMVLLFFGGVMNLYWIAGLALLVLIEKAVPYGERLGKVIGALLALWGLNFLYRAVIA